ncbi:signal peptide peptidase SppA [Lentimicrobium sp. L6]|uniref:signal peptide peptidase SppA n=1 Tax=Lentimicrobium sp. L6 TaxID=2735916 RepID=UPI00155560C3|nr:signal peptide peptidase SppA [Lentimicrobium sp. L6]NPD86349.1 signal peptide peptidase SppA [Lentimicrobium sp. L6]
MGQFFKFTLASVLGVILAIFLSIFILIGMMTAAISAGDEETVVEENSILRIKLNYPLNDRSVNDPTSIMNLSDFGKENPGLNEIIKSIEKGAEDPNIKGIYLNAPDVSGGPAQLEEIRKALLKFKESGKFIVAYATGYGQGAYYLASVADEVYLHPEGMILFKGFASEMMFYKGLFEKLDVEMQIIRHGKFKAAVEPFMLDKMSESNREQNTALLTSLWSNILNEISASRNISIEKLNEAADQLSLDNPKKALELKFIDGIKYPDEISALLKEKTEKAEDDDLEFLSIGKYKNSAFFKENTVAKDKIAVIYAAGEIKAGKGNDTYIGEENIRKAIIKAREDDRVKAIVMRVNSPGGSALVSDLIWREVTLTTPVKPVVVSMGYVAASGGYYISCAADYIYADPNTITGSIGVFGMIPNVNGFMTNKLGITFDEVSTNENGNYITINKALTPYQREVIQSSVERVYDSFITKVAKGRNMTKEDVDRIGQGRVWSGSQAIEIGLVDELGGMNEAIVKAAELAEIETYKLKELPVQKDPFQQILEDLTGQSSSIMMKHYLGEKYKYVEMMENMENRAVIQARLPFGMSSIK